MTNSIKDLKENLRKISQKVYEKYEKIENRKDKTI